MRAGRKTEIVQNPSPVPRNPLWFALLALIRPGLLCQRMSTAAELPSRALWFTGALLLLFAAMAHGLVLELLRDPARGLFDPHTLGPVLRIMVLGGVALLVTGWLATRVSALMGRNDYEERGLALAVMAAVPALAGFIFNPLALPWGRVVVAIGFAWALLVAWRAAGLLLGIPPGERAAFLIVIAVALTVALVAIGWPVTAILPGAW